MLKREEYLPHSPLTEPHSMVQNENGILDKELPVYSGIPQKRKSLPKATKGAFEGSANLPEIEPNS
jgi:hypothetical protein